MPRGMWKLRWPPLRTPGTVVVQPIGEATPGTAERYRRERDAVEQAGQAGQAERERR